MSSCGTMSSLSWCAAPTAPASLLSGGAQLSTPARLNHLRSIRLPRKTMVITSANEVPQPSKEDFPFQGPKGVNELTGFFSFPVIRRVGIVQNSEIQGVPPGGVPSVNDSLPLQWNNVLLEVVRDAYSTGQPSLPGPPAVARAFGIFNACMFDAWAYYDEDAVGIALPSALRSRRNERTLLNKRIAISEAAFTAILTLFPSGRSIAANFRASIPLFSPEDNFGMTGATFDSGVGGSSLEDLTFIVDESNGKMTLVSVDSGEVKAIADTTALESQVAAAPALPLKADPPGRRISPSEVGISAANAVLQRFANDGSNFPSYADTTSYRPFNANNTNRIEDPDRWTPLSVFVPLGGRANQDQFLLPHWGLGNRIAFALDRPSEFRPPPPFTPTTTPKEYNEQIDEILTFSRIIGEAGDEGDRLRAVAEYWADGPNNETAAGIHILQASFISRRDKHNLDKDIEFFTMLGGVLQDCAIAAWDAKREYDNARMITPIRILRATQKIRTWGGPGKDLVEVMGSNWLSYLPNPPFADHVSGHATFAGGAAKLFQAFTGNDVYGEKFVFKQGTSVIEPGEYPRQDVELSWPTHSSARDENGISRLYGGIHWGKANLDGQESGSKVAVKVIDFVKSKLGRPSASAQ